MQPGRSAKCKRARGRCVDAVRLQWCRRCGTQFAVCRSCDRNQEHCTRSCAAETRRTDLAEIRRRYRRSPAGREAHREQERRRRGRQREAARLAREATDADSVGDQTSQTDVAAGSVVPRGRTVPCTIVTSRLSVVPKIATGALQCHRCSMTTHFVAHGGWAPRWTTRDRGSTRSRLDRQITTENVRR
jgi:hypothetical protein